MNRRSDEVPFQAPLETTDVPVSDTLMATEAAAGAGNTATAPAGGAAGASATASSAAIAGSASAPVVIGQWTDFRRRFARNRLALVGFWMIIVVFLVAIFAPLIAPHDPLQQDLKNTLSGPSSQHWFGTDELGRDVFSRVIYGSRIAVIVGLTSVMLAVTIGIILGAIAGYFGRAFDAVIMRTADVFFAFPLLLGAIVIILVTGRGVMPVVLSLAIFTWATVARLLRASILSIRESEYVEAARSLGASRWRIVTRHILPNAIAPVLVFATFTVGAAVVAEAALSFLGVGVKPQTPEWGNMISYGQGFFGYKDYLWFFPSIAVVFTVLGFVFAGDGVRDALDPKLR